MMNILLFLQKHIWLVVLLLLVCSAEARLKRHHKAQMAPPVACTKACNKKISAMEYEEVKDYKELLEQKINSENARYAQEKELYASFPSCRKVKKIRKRCAYINQFFVHEYQKKLAECYQQLASVAPSCAERIEAQWQLANILFNVGRLDMAICFYDNLVKQCPQHAHIATIYFNYARACCQAVFDFRHDQTKTLHALQVVADALNCILPEQPYHQELVQYQNKLNALLQQNNAYIADFYLAQGNVAAAGKRQNV